jgi:hypothetical protein
MCVAVKNLIHLKLNNQNLHYSIIVKRFSNKIVYVQLFQQCLMQSKGHLPMVKIFGTPEIFSGPQQVCKNSKKFENNCNVF